MPGGTFLLAQSLRLHALRRLPFTFGWMAKRPIPNEIFDAWFRPLQTQRGVRRDLAKFAHTLDKGDMLAAAERLRRFDRPALVVWAPEDRVNPREHGRRFTAPIADLSAPVVGSKRIPLLVEPGGES